MGSEKKEQSKADHDAYVAKRTDRQTDRHKRKKTYGRRPRLEEQRGLAEPLLARGVVGHRPAGAPASGTCVCLRSPPLSSRFPFFSWVLVGLSSPGLLRRTCGVGVGLDGIDGYARPRVGSVQLGPVQIDAVSRSLGRSVGRSVGRLVAYALLCSSFSASACSS